MIKKILILIVFQVIVLDVFSQTTCERRHIYGLITNFYYLDILPEQNYSLKVGMYSDTYLVGKTVKKCDSIELTNLDMPSYAIREMSKFQIVDSLLIPLAYKELLPFSSSMLKDTTVCKEYLQSDGHVHYQLTFRSDSSFIYSTGSDRDRHVTRGKWIQNGNEISLQPENSDNLLYWICTDYKMIEVENYLVGKTFDQKNKVVEIHYLIGLKPRVKRKKNQQLTKAKFHGR